MKPVNRVAFFLGAWIVAVAALDDSFRRASAPEPSEVVSALRPDLAPDARPRPSPSAWLLGVAWMARPRLVPGLGVGLALLTPGSTETERQPFVLTWLRAFLEVPRSS